MAVQTKVFPRGAGIFLSIASLPSVYGIGTLGGPAYRFVDLLVDLKQKYWQVSSLAPESLGDNPWSTVSAFAGNPYLIDPDELQRGGMLSGAELERLVRSDDDENTELAVIYENYLELLRTAFGRFDVEGESFRQFCRENEEWLPDYSLFMAARVSFGNREWTEWEPGLRNREPAALERYRAVFQKEIQFWEFCQYQFFQQWNGLRKYAGAKGIQLIGDLPFYVAFDSADVWADRDGFLLSESGFPEVLNGYPSAGRADRNGEWGNPVYNWLHMEDNGFSWWRRRMRIAASRYDIIRIERFADAIKYYCIPAGAVKEKGKWFKGPGRKLVDVVEEAAGDCGIISGDLEAVSHSMKKITARKGWLEMKTLVLAFDGNASNENLPHNYKDADIVVYTGSADKNGIVSYYKNRTEQELAFLYQYLGIDSREQIADAFIKLAYSSVADVVITQMRDILKPGRGNAGYPRVCGPRDWKWRLKKDGLTAERRAWLRTLATIYRR